MRATTRRAISFVAELRQKANDISRNPLAYPLVPRFEQRGIRRLVCHDYLMFYRADEDAVHIVHLQQAAQDCEAHLFPLED